LKEVALDRVCGELVLQQATDLSWGRDFPHLSILGPTQPPLQWLPGLSRG